MSTQDISVTDKTHPALGATEEEQDVSTLNRIVVPVGAYLDPNNPASQSASVNLSVESSPLEHDKDYGKSSLEDAGVEADPVASVAGAGGSTSSRPADRADWSKADWQSQASEYGLATSGNMDTIAARVEAYEDENNGS